MIWALPALSPEARPLPFTEATEEALEDQVKLTPGMMLPEASLAVAVNCWVWLTLICAVGENGVTLVTAVIVRSLAVENPAQLT